MGKKKKEHTGFRNGNLFCYNCGASYEMPLPQPISMAAALMNQFAKDHEKCPPTWKEPVNDGNGKTVEENANWWAQNGRHGISSITMFNALTQGLNVRALKNDHPSHPGDPDDFNRCYLLLKAVPQWQEKSQLDRLRKLSPVWNNLVENWDKLTEMLEEQIRTKKPNGMYEFMNSLGC